MGQKRGWERRKTGGLGAGFFTLSQPYYHGLHCRVCSPCAPLVCKWSSNYPSHTVITKMLFAFLCLFLEFIASASHSITSSSTVLCLQPLSFTFTVPSLSLLYSRNGMCSLVKEHMHAVSTPHVALLSTNAKRLFKANAQFALKSLLAHMQLISTHVVLLSTPTGLADWPHGPFSG